jgi:hypothetical protein
MNAPALSRIESCPDVSHAEMANAIRFLAIDAVEKAKSGHPGMPMGMADVATVLFSRFLKFDPTEPAWPDRDRFVLSAGHGSMLLYALLHLTGYAGVTSDELRAFRQWGSKTRRFRRSLHLCDRRRRLPDGRPQPRGDLADRPFAAQPSDRAVRRQRNLDRRRDIAILLG